MSVPPDATRCIHQLVQVTPSRSPDLVGRFCFMQTRNTATPYQYATNPRFETRPARGAKLHHIKRKNIVPVPVFRFLLSPFSSCPRFLHVFHSHERDCQKPTDSSNPWREARGLSLRAVTAPIVASRCRQCQFGHRWGTPRCGRIPVPGFRHGTIVHDRPCGTHVFCVGCLRSMSPDSAKPWF